MRSKLMKMNLHQLREICKRMNCDIGTKNKMIEHLLKPLNQKYKMESKSFSKFKKGYIDKDSLSALSEIVELRLIT